MRFRFKLFYVFLALVLVVAPIVEASKKRKRVGGGKKSKKQKLAPSTISTTTLGTNEGIPIQGISGPGLRSEGTSGEGAGIGGASPYFEGGRSEVLPLAVSENDVESDDILGKEFREAVEEGNFEWLYENWKRWKDRRDLLNDVIRRGADFFFFGGR